jgi:hypothetical protein
MGIDVGSPALSSGNKAGIRPVGRFPGSGLRVGLALLAFALMLAVGFVYLVSGLIVPIPALYGVWALWVVLAGTQILMRRRLWLVMSMPAIALTVLVAIASLGDLLLGWTA